MGSRFGRGMEIGGVRGVFEVVAGGPERIPSLTPSTVVVAEEHGLGCPWRRRQWGFNVL